MSFLPSTRTWPGTARTAAALALLGTTLALTTITVPQGSAAATSSRTLVGTLQLTAGSCAGGKVTGTYLRMILPSGGPNGPYLSNSDSRCSDRSFTPLAPGTDGGLRFGSYQPTPTPRFGPDGDAKARRITAPAAFYGTSFATATSPVDPQTKASVPAPSLTVTGSKVTADLRSFAVTWNNQDFNQGAPKPNGSTPGNTRIASGSYDPRTGAITLSWASQVVGGPFDKFTGAWHLEGRFVPAAGTRSSGSSAGAPSAPGAGEPASRGTTGSVAAPGVPAAAGKPATGKPARAEGLPGVNPVVDAPASAPVTKIVSTDRWRVSWPVVGLAVGIGLLAIGALVLSSVLSRRTEGP